MNTPLTVEQRKALENLNVELGHGSIKWREALSNAWMAGEDATLPGGPYLRQIRNALGPTWLMDTYAWGWLPEMPAWMPMKVGSPSPGDKLWWSGKGDPPAVGSRVVGIGNRPGTVTGYFAEAGYLGVTVRTDVPFNGHPVGHYFGAELVG